MIDFATIRSNHELATTVEQYTPLSGRGKHLNGPCPFCGGNDRFYVNTHGQRWGCRKCTPKSGDVIDFIAKLESVSIADAVRILEGFPQVHAAIKNCNGNWRPDEWQRKARTILEVSRALALRPRARAYLESRGLDFDICLRYGIGYDGCRWRPQSKTEAPAIVIPWRFADGKVTAIKYRFIDEAAENDRRLRFVQLSGSEQTLFGTDLCKGAHTLIVTEGEFNCIALRQVLEPDHFDVVSFGSEATIGYLPCIARRSYGQIVLWQDDPSKVARTLSLIGRPLAAVITSVSGRDACDWLQEDPAALRSRVLAALGGTS